MSGGGGVMNPRRWKEKEAEKMEKPGLLEEKEGVWDEEFDSGFCERAVFRPRLRSRDHVTAVIKLLT